MKPHLREAIVGGDTGIMLTLSAADLRSVVSEMVSQERARIDAEAERRRELYVVSRKEAARKLNTSCPTLRKRELDGSLVPMRFGSKVYYRQSDIDEYFKRQQTH